MYEKQITSWGLFFVLVVVCNRLMYHEFGLPVSHLIHRLNVVSYRDSYIHKLTEMHLHNSLYWCSFALARLVLALAEHL
jgi:hypothetical protein